MIDGGLRRLLSGHLAPGTWRAAPAAEARVGEALGEAAARGWFCYRLSPAPVGGLALALAAELGLAAPLADEEDALFDCLVSGGWPVGARVMIVILAPDNGQATDAGTVDRIVTNAAAALATGGVGLYLVWIGGEVGADLAYWNGLD